MIDQNKEISRVTYNGTDIPIKSEGGEEIEWEYFVKGENYSVVVVEMLALPLITMSKSRDGSTYIESSIIAGSYLGILNENFNQIPTNGLKVSPLMVGFNTYKGFLPKGTSFSTILTLFGVDNGLLTQITKEEYDALGVE